MLKFVTMYFVFKTNRIFLYVSSSRRAGMAGRVEGGFRGRYIYITDLIISYRHGDDDDDRRENSLSIWIAGKRIQLVENSNANLYGPPAG